MCGHWQHMSLPRSTCETEGGIFSSNQPSPSHSKCERRHIQHGNNVTTLQQMWQHKFSLPRSKCGGDILSTTTPLLETNDKRHSRPPPPLPCLKRATNGIHTHHHHYSPARNGIHTHHHHNPAWLKLQTRAFVLDSGVSAPSNLLIYYIILYYVIFNLIKKTRHTRATGAGFRWVTSS